MHIITQKRIREAQRNWPQAHDALSAWLRIMRRVEPENAAQLQVFFPGVDKVGGLFVFNIGGHRLRLIALVRFKVKRVYIRAIIDHKEYDKGNWKK
ncbi:type II toxin-antitoxin system HigB family toxin [Thiolapillus sp.]